MKKNLLLLLACIFLAASSDARIRVRGMDQALGKIYIENFYFQPYNYEDFQLSIGATYHTLKNLSFTTGNLANWQSGEVIEFTGVSFPNSAGASVSIWYPNSLPGNAVPFNIVDFLQYGAAGHPYESVAVQAGYWMTGDFITAPFPILFTGGELDYGSSFYVTGIVGIQHIPGAGLSWLVNTSPDHAAIYIAEDFGRGLPVRLDIYHANGMLVRRTKEQPAGMIDLDLGAWDAGLYLVRLTNAYNRSVTGKVTRP